MKTLLNALESLFCVNRMYVRKEACCLYDRGRLSEKLHRETAY